MIPETRKPILQGWAQDFEFNKMVEEKERIYKNIQIFEEAITKENIHLEELEYMRQFKEMKLIDRKN